MRKFFLKPEEIGENFMVLTGEQYNHARVLRMKNGDNVIVCDGQGNDYSCVISDISEGRVSLVVQGKASGEQEPAVSCRIYMGFPKADKLEHVIQKATELGADEIVAFPCVRCVFKADEKNLSKKMERWQKIAASAAEQCGRGRIPSIRCLPSYKAMLEDAASCDLKVLFYENEDHRTFRAAIEDHVWETAALISGPEGGFEPAEVASAKAAGFEICTLGSRILRCETAPLCALSALMYAAGEF